MHVIEPLMITAALITSYCMFRKHQENEQLRNFAEVSAILESKYVFLRKQFPLGGSDDGTRRLIADQMMHYAAIVLRQYGFHIYAQVCDSSNNPPSVVLDKNLVYELFVHVHGDQLNLCFTNELLSSPKYVKESV